MNLQQGDPVSQNSENICEQVLLFAPTPFTILQTWGSTSGILENGAPGMVT